MTLTDYERWSELSDREALGESLSTDERSFLDSFAEIDPLAGAERDLWGAFAALEPLPDEIGNRALASAAVKRVVSDAKPQRRTLWMSAGGALAAAAAVAVLVHGQRTITPTAEGGSVLEYVAAEARVGGAAAARGAHASVGRGIEAVGGPVCVAVEPKIHACLAAGSKIRLSSLGASKRHVELLSGRVGVALAPLPKGERFSIVANQVWSTAVGTAFSVELLAGGAVETIVHEGKVAVGAENGAEVVPAHKIGLASGPGADVAITALADHARTETGEWTALASFAGRSIEAAPTAAAEAPVAPAPAEPAEAVASPEPSRASRKSAAEAKPEAAGTVPATSSASELLATARQALREQRWADAAASYERIITGFPASAEAHTVLVSLARLELDRLGRADSALTHLGAYLAKGGPLDVEAELLQIRAYRSLHRSAEEARAIDRFLAAHPNNLERPQLEAERERLRTP